MIKPEKTLNALRFGVVFRWRIICLHHLIFIPKTVAVKIWLIVVMLSFLDIRLRFLSISAKCFTTFFSHPSLLDNDRRLSLCKIPWRNLSLENEISEKRKKIHLNSPRRRRRIPRVRPHIHGDPKVNWHPQLPGDCRGSGKNLAFSQPPIHRFFGWGEGWGRGRRYLETLPRILVGGETCIPPLFFPFFPLS